MRINSACVLGVQMQLGRGASQTAETERALGDNPEPSSCLLSPPNQPYIVKLYFSAMDRVSLQRAMGSATHGPPRRSGGILVGRQSAGPERFVSILSFVPVAKEEEDAEASATPTRAISQLLQTWSDNEGRGMHAVGYYCLCPRGQQDLLPEDLALVRRLSAPVLVMLIDPTTLDARLYVRAGGDTEEPARLDFLFERHALTSAASTQKTSTDEPGITHPRAVHAIDAAARQARADGPPRTNTGAGEVRTLRQRVDLQKASYPAVRRGARVWWVWGALTLLFATGLLIAWFLDFREPRIASATSTLGLHLDRVGSDLRLTWNRDAAVVKRARGGVLSISDGGVRRDVTLGASEIRHGMVVYSVTAAHNVKIQLRVLSDSGPVSESVLFVSDPDKPAVHGEGRSAPATGNLSFRKPAPAPRLPAGTTEPDGSRDLRRSAVAARAFQPPPQKPRVIPEPELLANSPSRNPIPLSAIAGVVPVSTASSLPEPPKEGDHRGRLNGDLASAAPAPGAIVKAQPPSAAAVTAGAGQNAATAPSRASALQGVSSNDGDGRSQGYTPPKVIRRVMPVIPPPIRGVMRRESFDVRVRLLISPSGKVVSALPVSRENGQAALLVPAASDAARAWLFEPAMLNGKEVASELLVTFRFAR